MTKEEIISQRSRLSTLWVWTAKNEFLLQVPTPSFSHGTFPSVSISRVYFHEILQCAKLFGSRSLKIFAFCKPIICGCMYQQYQSACCWSGAWSVPLEGEIAVTTASLKKMGTELTS